MEIIQYAPLGAMSAVVVATVLREIAIRRQTGDRPFAFLEAKGAERIAGLSFAASMAEPMRGTLESRQLVVRNSLDYDCNNFGSGGLCLSAGVRDASLDGPNQTAVVLIASLEISETLHVGAFVDIGGNEIEASGIEASRSPMFGGFVDFNEKPNGEGLQGRLAAAYENGDATFAHANLTGTAVTAFGDGELYPSGETRGLIGFYAAIAVGCGAQFHGRSSWSLLTGQSAIRDSASASQACGSTSLSFAVWISV